MVPSQNSLPPNISAASVCNHCVTIFWPLYMNILWPLCDHSVIILQPLCHKKGNKKHAKTIGILKSQKAEGEKKGFGPTPVCYKIMLHLAQKFMFLVGVWQNKIQLKTQTNFKLCQFTFLADICTSVLKEIITEYVQLQDKDQCRATQVNEFWSHMIIQLLFFSFLNTIIV